MSALGPRSGTLARHLPRCAAAVAPRTPAAAMPCPSACAAPVRHFASSPRIAARKSPVGPRVDSDVEGLTGDPDKDGMNIYQIDFLETAMWTKELLLKMQHHEHLLKGLQQDDVPVDDAAILTFKTTSVYDYDYTKPSPEAANKRVECTFQVSKLVAMQKWSGKQRHKLLLLCGEHYDPQTGTVTLSCEKFDERIYNKIYLSDTVDRLISEVRKLGDLFEDIPLDLRHLVVPKKIGTGAGAKKLSLPKLPKPKPQVWQTPAFWAVNLRTKREAREAEEAGRADEADNVVA